MGALVTYRSNIEDSTRWERFPFRPGDVVISSPSKSGTTWTQRLVALVVFDGDEFPAPFAEMTPWLDMTLRSEATVFDILERQQHRRFIKTHTPLDGVPVVDDVVYVAVGRDPRDAAISMAHHINNLDYDRMVEVAGALGGDYRPGDLSGFPFPADVFLRQWIEPGQDQWWPFEDLLHQYQVTWDLRHRANVELFHYADYHRDLSAELVRLAAHLGSPVERERAGELAALASIDHMRERAPEMAPDGQLGFWKDPRTFFRSGRRGQWHDLLSAEEVERYETRVAESVDAELAHWIHHGWTG